MNEMQVRPAVNPGYAGGQLAKAFHTAATHEDEATRRRAEERVRRWTGVAQGMADGSLTIGSRTPVRGLPAWVTPEVVRGGFATGDAAAGGPWTAHEAEVAARAGLRTDDRLAVFRYFLTDAGLDELYTMLDSGRYHVAVPEEAALLTVAWLLRAGDRFAALTLLDEITPYADRLRFLPRVCDTPVPDGSAVHRESVGSLRATLGARRPKPAVEAMNEALTVWNPFADQLLAHWLETVDDGRLGAVHPAGWTERGRELLERYRRLSVRHTLCTKHRNPRGNSAILLAALAEALDGPRTGKARGAGARIADHLTGRTARGAGPRGAARGAARPGLLRHAVDAMVAKRGVPGSPAHAELRARQAADASTATLHELARVLITRLANLRDDAGLPDTAWLLVPVTDEEAERTGVRAGSPIPDSLRHPVERALSAPVATLVERGIVPSAEVLAELVPQLVAATTALAYHDPALRTLMTAGYGAFAERRSLLLLNLEHQVRMEELPWVRAVSAYRRVSTDTAGNAREALAELGTLTVRAFPGTIVPNPMLQELGSLARQAGVGAVFTEELAADIFMGTFSVKFLRAAQNAGELLEGSLYARYYGIDYAAIREIADVGRERGFAADTSDAFATLCRERADIDTRGRSWVAANGKVIEQAQILTTHNLAALVHPIGVEPAEGWAEPARGAYRTVCRLVQQIAGNPRSLGTVKDAAYAWRQTLFFLSLCGVEDQFAVIAWMAEETARRPKHTVRRLAPVLAGLRHVFTGGTLDDPASPNTRRFLGWATDGHWMRTA
ncbi:hypothetical protein [Embleya hyalina]|uniref:Uncharacterized protein n=1 Tax=Embleya hyalina TaxID=516124 RepID=A0A401YTI7_9ACTN|nr:hypothetical protein [Embleya hyalina]GCD97892.1 hypothetical protein EHYA_05589 [Embleya hyalina]